MRFCLWLLSLLFVVLIAGNGSCAEAQDVRIRRPAGSPTARLTGSNSGALGTNPNELSPVLMPVTSDRLDIGIVKVHDRWLERYVNPVFCPVDICHSSCAAYDDACLLSGSQPVLSYFGELNGFVLRGCGGACSQSHGQSDLVNSVHAQASGSCCH